MTSLRTYSLLLLYFVLVLIGGALLPARSEAQDVAPQLRATILLRTLAYESHTAGGSGQLVFAVVGAPSGRSARDAAAMLDALRTLARRVTVADRRVRVVSVTHQSAARTASALDAAGADVVYVATGTSGLSAALSGAHRSRGRVVLCGDPGDVSNGCVLSVETAGRGSRPVVNVGHARRAGLEFNARVLRLSRVVR